MTTPPPGTLLLGVGALLPSFELTSLYLLEPEMTMLMMPRCRSMCACESAHIPTAQHSRLQTVQHEHVVDVELQAVLSPPSATLSQPEWSGMAMAKEKGRRNSNREEEGGGGGEREEGETERGQEREGRNGRAVIRYGRDGVWEKELKHPHPPSNQMEEVTEDPVKSKRSTSTTFV